MYSRRTLLHCGNEAIHGGQIDAWWWRVTAQLIWMKLDRHFTQSVRHSSERLNSVGVGVHAQVVEDIEVFVPGDIAF